MRCGKRKRPPRKARLLQGRGSICEEVYRRHAGELIAIWNELLWIVKGSLSAGWCQHQYGLGQLPILGKSNVAQTNIQRLKSTIHSSAHSLKLLIAIYTKQHAA